MPTALNGRNTNAGSHSWFRAFAVVVACAIGLFFVWTTIQKVLAPGSTMVVVRRLTDWPADAGMRAVLAASVLEWTLGLWLISGIRQRQGLIVSVVVVVGFTAILVALRLDGFNGDCGCGGGSFSVSAALFRNGVVPGLLGAALVAPADRRHGP